MAGLAGGWRYCSGAENDWDLRAVVRYGCRGRAAPPPGHDDPFSSLLAVADLQGGGRVDPAVAVAGDEFFNAFFAAAAAAPPQPPPEQRDLAVPVMNDEAPQMERGEEDVPPVPRMTVPRPSNGRPPVAPPPAGRLVSGGGGGERFKRRKRVVKKVVETVAADGKTTADPWAWRKYGQKPIKGSPYPRGYYRCSTTKACPARKMVERSRTDPDSFVVVYTGGDHIHPVPVHRNSLSGTTRHRLLQTSADAAAAAASASSKTGPGQSPTAMSPISPSAEFHQEEDFDGGASQQQLNDVDMASDDDELQALLNPYGPAMDSSSYMPADDDDDDKLMASFLVPYSPPPSFFAGDGGSSSHFTAADARASLQPKDMEMSDDENELLKFLSPYDDPAMDVLGGGTGGGFTSSYMAADGGGAGKIPLLNVVHEKFVAAKPWVTAPGAGAAAWS